MEFKWKLQLVAENFSNLVKATSPKIQEYTKAKAASALGTS